MRTPKLSFPSLLIGLFGLLTTPTCDAQNAAKQRQLGMTTAQMAKLVSTSEKLKQDGWSTSLKSPYPYAAMRTHEQGLVYVEMATDAKGKVVHTVVPIDPQTPIITPYAAKYILENWHGPANSKAVVVLTFRLM